jgi:phenylpyruvate tautomerase PptA (4-oxalocrotonate tautomerase family)
MVSISPAAMLISGKAGHSCFVHVRSIGGLSDEVNRKLSQKVCRVLQETLNVSSDRVYLNFTDVPAANWGWNAGTFG